MQISDYFTKERTCILIFNIPKIAISGDCVILKKIQINFKGKLNKGCLVLKYYFKSVESNAINDI